LPELVAGDEAAAKGLLRGLLQQFRGQTTLGTVTTSA